VCAGVVLACRAILVILNGVVCAETIDYNIWH